MMSVEEFKLDVRLEPFRRGVGLNQTITSAFFTHLRKGQITQMRKGVIRAITPLRRRRRQRTIVTL